MADAKPRWGGAPTEKCFGCAKTVYPAEKVVMQDLIWHIDCLKCVECNKKLSGSNWGGYLDSKPYCSIHLNRIVLAQGPSKIASAPSPSEHASSSSASSSSSSSSASSASTGAKPKWGGGVTDKCTGCGKTVYVAEKIVMQEQIWHIECLRCVECNKKLVGSNWGGFVPPDNKPYCSAHHMKLVQAQGGATAFSGSTGSWSSEKKPASSSTSTSGAKSRFGGGGEEICTGCGKKAYQAEKMKMEGQVWHPTCLRCVECNKMLSGSNWGAFVPPDNKPYCKNHFDKLVAAAGSAVDFSGSTSLAKWGGASSN